METKQKQQLENAARRLIALGDDPGIFMTCESGGTKPCVRIGCQNVKHAQDVHRAIIDIVNAARECATDLSANTETKKEQ